MRSSALPVHCLELRVRELKQLFNSMDPSPFRNQDLDRTAEAYIESWAQAFPRDTHLQILVHVEQLPAETNTNVLVGEAIHNYFDYKVGLVRGELRQLFRHGRISLLIGLAFVTACLLGADAIGQTGTSNASTIARESLTIIGWVAMWRPVQIYLYDWWPLVQRIHIFANLSRASVSVIEGT